MISRRGVLAGLAAMGAAPAFAGTITLDQLVGESLILGFLGSTPDAEGADRIERDLAEGRIGGVLFLRHNARTREGVLGLARRFRAAALSVLLDPVHPNNAAKKATVCSVLPRPMSSARIPPRPEDAWRQSHFTPSTW